VQYSAPHANWTEANLPTDIVGVFVDNISFAQERVSRLEFWQDGAVVRTAHFNSAACSSFLFVGNGHYEIPFSNFTDGALVSGLLYHNGDIVFTADRAVITNVATDCEYTNGNVSASHTRTRTPSLSPTPSFTAPMKSPYRRAMMIMSIILYSAFISVD
jgi:hypothetical protein